MKDRNAFEILQDYPKEKGLAFETHESERHFYLTPNDPILNTKFVIFKKESIVFFAYDSFATKAFMNQTFTGIYSISNLENDFECEINKKDWLDNFRRNKWKTGNQKVGNNLTLISKSAKRNNNCVTEDIVSLFLKLNNSIKPIKLIIQKDYLPLIQDFKNNNIVGLETNQWIYKSEEIDLLLNLGGEIIKKLNKISG
jgi:hypothetical protein